MYSSRSHRDGAEMEQSSPSTWQVFKSVMASFFGVQKEEIRQRDFTYGKPSQFIIIGLILTVSLMVILYFLVKVILYFAMN